MVKRQNFNSALKRLDEALNAEYSMIVGDAVIQRFEFTFELAWKSLRDYLKNVHGLICNSPKQCFREGFSLGLYDQETAERLLQMVDDRNETTHTYDENKIAQIFENVKDHYSQLLNKIYQLTEN